MVDGLSILPLDFSTLERATQLRRQKGDASKRKGSIGDETDIAVECSYLLLATNRSSCLPSGAEREQQRTGRWTDEEIAFVDYLVMAFDQGQLSLPHGIKLNEFLGEVLICKSSRLTKKMKNAKLSTRSFALGHIPLGAQPIDHRHLSVLQEKFLQSINSEPTQLELRFNVMKQWRTHFSNLCVQVGYPYLDAREWVASLEEMERRAANAEDILRKSRRKRMGLALQTDGGTAASSSVFIGGVQADSVASQAQSVPLIADSGSQGPRRLSDSSENGSENGDDDMLSLLEAFDADDEPNPKRSRTRSLSQDLFTETKKDRAYSEDFESVLRELIEPSSEAGPDPPQTTSTAPTKRPPNHSCGPFLDAITMFMESKNLPFQHADVWVPSFLPREGKGPSKAVDTEQLRLFHAGYATRGDLDDDVAHTLHEFGAYSDNFSFEPGHGLPGRVYTSGEIAWDCGIDEADPKRFERAGGAKIYGVKTAVGIPLSTPLVGRMVVAMYSKDDIPQDMMMAKECAAELMKYSPEPKWKLVIEMKNEPKKTLSTGRAATAKAAGQGSSCANPSGSTPVASTDQEEQRIVTLLGEHMPLSTSSTGESTSSSADNLQHFMSMRLLLIRPAGRRTSRENEMIQVLKSSFRAYSKDNRRSGAELASLLAKDWVCLKQTFASMSTARAPNPPVRRNSSMSSMNSVARHPSSTELALSQTHAQLLQGGFAGNNPHPGAPGMNGQRMFGIPQPTPMAPFHRAPSMGIRRGSNFSQGAQPISQPQQVISSRPPQPSRPY